MKRYLIESILLFSSKSKAKQSKSEKTSGENVNEILFGVSKYGRAERSFYNLEFLFALQRGFWRRIYIRALAVFPYFFTSKIWKNHKFCLNNISPFHSYRKRLIDKYTF